MKARHRSGIGQAVQAVVESLEARKLMSVSVTVSGGVLTIVGDAANQVVLLKDSSIDGGGAAGSAYLSLDANGDGDTSDPGDFLGTIGVITKANLSLCGGDDQVRILLDTPYNGVSKEFHVVLGKGNDTFRFSNANQDLTLNRIDNSTVKLFVDGGNGNDTIGERMGRMTNSIFEANVLAGAGEDTVSLYRDDDRIGTTDTFTADLGDGNDTFRYTNNAENFDILGQVTQVKTNVWGGSGDDLLRADTDEQGSPSTLVEGLHEVGFYGGAGNDTLTMWMSDFRLIDGSISLSADGGKGCDTISVSANITAATPYGAPASTGQASICLSGGCGNDSLTAHVDAPSGSVTWGSIGGVLLDGGPGADVATFDGTASPVFANIP